MSATITVQMHNPDTGRKFAVVVKTTQTVGDAVAIMNTKVALIKAVVDSATVTQDLVSAGEALPTPNAGGSANDATLILRKTIGGVKRTVIQKINEMSSSYRLGTSEGDVDVSNGDITDFATVYEDSAGNTGWTPVSGYYRD